MLLKKANRNSGIKLCPLPKIKVALHAYALQKKCSVNTMFQAQHTCIGSIKNKGTSMYLSHDYIEHKIMH